MSILMNTTSVTWKKYDNGSDETIIKQNISHNNYN